MSINVPIAGPYDLVNHRILQEKCGDVRLDVRGIRRYNALAELLRHCAAIYHGTMDPLSEYKIGQSSATLYSWVKGCRIARLNQTHFSSTLDPALADKTLPPSDVGNQRRRDLIDDLRETARGEPSVFNVLIELVKGAELHDLVRTFLPEELDANSIHDSIVEGAIAVIDRRRIAPDEFDEQLSLISTLTFAGAEEEAIEEADQVLVTWSRTTNVLPILLKNLSEPVASIVRQSLIHSILNILSVAANEHYRGKGHSGPV